MRGYKFLSSREISETRRDLKSRPGSACVHAVHAMLQILRPSSEYSRSTSRSLWLVLPALPPRVTFEASGECGNEAHPTTGFMSWFTESWLNG